MNFDELEKIMSESGVNICPYCGMPYDKYHSRQKTCGNTECRKAYKSQYLKDYRERLFAEDPDAYRKKRNEQRRRERDKKRMVLERDEQLEKIQKRWQKQSDLDKIVAEHGMEYGKMSAEKVLASVPKIDVNLGGNRNDNVHDQNNAE